MLNGKDLYSTMANYFELEFEIQFIYKPRLQLNEDHYGEDKLGLNQVKAGFQLGLA